MASSAATAAATTPVPLRFHVSAPCSHRMVIICSSSPFSSAPEFPDALGKPVQGHRQQDNRQPGLEAASDLKALDASQHFGAQPAGTDHGRDDDHGQRHH